MVGADKKETDPTLDSNFIPTFTLTYINFVCYHHTHVDYFTSKTLPACVVLYWNGPNTVELFLVTAQHKILIVVCCCWMEIYAAQLWSVCTWGLKLCCSTLPSNAAKHFQAAKLLHLHMYCTVYYSIATVMSSNHLIHTRSKASDEHTHSILFLERNSFTHSHLHSLS